MKSLGSLALLTFAFLFSATSLFALNIPSSVYRVDNLKEAVAKAIEKEQPISFIYSNSKLKPQWATCSGTVSLASIKAVRTWSTVVFIDSIENKDWHKLPKTLQKKVSSLPGGTIPVLFVTDYKFENDFGTFAYSSLKRQDFRDLFREPKKQIKVAKEEGALRPEADQPKPQKSPLPTSKRTWTNSAGKKISASIIAADDSSVTFLIKNKKVIYPLEKLSEKSRQEISELLNENNS